MNTATYKVTDLCNGNTIIVDKYNVREKMTDWYDMHEGVAEAIENIEDYLYRRLNEPEWGSTFLNVRIEPVEEEEKVKLVWNKSYTDRTGDHCCVYIVMADDEDEINFDFADLADYPGRWDTPDPYIDAENDLLARNGYTRDDVAEVVTPW